jgi:gustatory receptor
MKTRKVFWGKSNKVSSAKRAKLTSNISVLMKPMKVWRSSGNVEFIPREESKGDCSGSFHRAIYPLMIIATCFGVMPVNNISSKCPAGLTFTWKSIRFFFAIFVMISCGLESFSTISWTFSTNVEFGKLVILIFYVTNLLSFFCFICLAKEWPNLMRKWHEVEKKLPPVETAEEKRAMTWRIRKTAAIILTLSAVEHILSIVSSVAVVLDCPKIKNIVKAYYVHNFPQVFKFFSFSHPLGIYVKFIHITATFVWSYADLFIMVVSQGLSAKFKQINERMLKDKGKVSCVDEAHNSMSSLLFNYRH